MSPLVSVIIPVKKINDYIRQEVVPALKKQTYQNFELIIVPDKHGDSPASGSPGGSSPGVVRVFPSWPKLGPADKKDLGVKRAKGEIIAFIDDDAYPSKDWLKNAVKYFQNKKIAAVCGPGVTPENDSLLSKVSGWMWSSSLGAGGAGTYRCWPGKKREVDDYPTFNLIVRKSDFEKVGGFDSMFWPGEDTKLCYDLVYKLKKKIIYDPKILVYHHRRDILIPHLKQIGRYGLHRGFFVKILPKTSKRVGYFLPPLFTLGVLFGPLTYLFFKPLFNLYLLALLAYFFLLIVTAFWVLAKSKNLLMALLVMPTIFISHMFYGLMFLKGITKRVVKSKYSRQAL